MLLTLKGKPESTNQLYRSMCLGRMPRIYMTPEGKALKESYKWQLKSQWKKEPIEGDVDLRIVLYFSDKRRRDIDNYNKILYDAMSGIIYGDDSQIKKVETVKQHDKESRIEIEIIN